MRDDIPQELRALPQWVCAAADKVPRNPKTGGPASVLDSETWGTFEQAVEADYPHIGFVLTHADPFTIIDLDAPQSPEQEARHQKIVRALPSYAERSQSGKGLHIIVRGCIPSGVHRDKVEAYSSSRYMICTGEVVADLPIADCQPMLDVLYREMQPAQAVGLKERPELLDDKDLVEMATLAANGDKFAALCRGEWEQMGYPSQSEADLALLSILAYYSPSDEQVRRLFRYSALGKRDKATRNDRYLNGTLGKIRAQQPRDVDLSKLALCAPAIAAPPQPSAAADNCGSGANTREELPELAMPPGLVGDIAQYIYQSSPRPVQEFALVASLGLVAGIAGRAYHTAGAPTGLNLYLVLIGKTGIGKDCGKLGINQLLAAVRPQVPMVDQFVGPSAFASGQALVKHFDGRPCFYSVLGEFGHLLKRITAIRASSAEQALHGELLSLYSQSGPLGRVGEYVHSDKEKNTKIVQAPSLTIIGESTPEVFFDCLDSALVQDGLVPRLLVVEYSGKRPPTNKGAGGKPAKPLVDALANLATAALSAERNSQFVKVVLSAEAEALLDAFDRECDDHINDGNVIEVQLWNRAHLNALKVASVVAVGRAPHGPVVTLAEAQWSVAFVRRSVLTVQSRFDTGEVGGGEGAKADAAIRAAIDAFISMTPELRKTYKTQKAFQTGPVVPYAFLYAKLKRVQPFKTDRRVLDDSLRALVDASVLEQLPSQQVEKNYGLHTKAYAVGQSW